MKKTPYKSGLLNGGNKGLQKVHDRLEKQDSIDTFG